MWDCYDYTDNYSPAYSSIVSVQKSDEDPLNTDAIVEPVTLTEAKRWLRIDLGETAEDDLITAGITAARQAIEEYLNRSLIKRTVTVTMNIAGGSVNLPYAPVISPITSVTDTESNLIDTTGYTLNGDTVLIGGYSQAVFVYNAGYEDATKVPQVFKRGILRLLAFDWENRGDTSVKVNIGDITRLRSFRRVV